MCTLSWISGPQSLSVIFNRDESENREPAVLPEVTNYKGGAVIRPVDPEGGGSWIAANNQGLIVCLLNYYDAAHGEPQVRTPISRGVLVNRLSECVSFSALETDLKNSELSQFRPFILVVFHELKGPVVWRWTGDELSQVQGVRSPVVTSSTWSRSSGLFRRFLFRNHKHKSNEHQLKLHRMSWPGLGVLSPAMRRKGRSTVSTTQIKLDAHQVTMNYWAGHPEVQPVEPSRTVTLPMQSSGVISHTAPQVQSLNLLSVLQEKNPALAARLKPWHLWLLNQITALPKFQDKLEQFAPYAPERFFDEVLVEVGAEIEVKALSWPDAEQRPVFVCNHPTGGLDGIALLAVLRMRYPDIRVVANDLLGLIPQIKALQIPVDVFGNRAASVRTLHRAFASDQPLLIFPAGKTARYQQGQLDDGPWSRMPVSMASRHQRVIMPLHLQACNSRKFYALSWLRQRLGIQANLEMLLLVREMLKPATRNVTLLVGESIQMNDVVRENTALQQLADQVKQASYGLKEVVGGR